MSGQPPLDGPDGIAIIGMAGRFPGAPDVDAFWRNLRDGVDAIRSLSDAELLEAGVNPALLADPRYVKAGPVLDDVELFDAEFFGFSAREAELTDPQHRLFLECAWQALEHAGHDPDQVPSRVGVFAGAGLNTYLLRLAAARDVLNSADALQAILANANDHLATQVSYKLNLRGPSLSVQTACSTSLVAVHLAFQSLMNGESDMALAGGVSIGLPQRAGYLYQEGMVLSPDGRCRAFDAKAEGTVGSSGAGIVVLKRLAEALADGDTVYAVIRGSAINNDGAAKVGYTAPSVDGQAEVIAEALALAGVDPETVSYVEAHGTGTPFGDPIEVAALRRAFGEGHGPARCALGSVKTNVGHLDAAAGVTGLIKTALALHHRLLPPILHYERPNPRIDFGSFYVNAAPTPWPAGPTPRRAGVSSFGIGGTNAHVVLEEAPPASAADSAPAPRLLVLSARSATALEAATVDLAARLRAGPAQSLADVAYTLQIGRRPFGHRRVLVADDPAEAADALQARDPRRVLTGGPVGARPEVAFLFPGQGAQYVGMAHGLYQSEPTFRADVDECCELLRPYLGLDLRDVLFPPAEAAKAARARLNRTELTQTALFVIEYALARFWLARGVRPSAMLGHSLGEYVAACLAGVFAIEDALALVAARGRLMQALPGGAMLAVPLAEAEVAPLLGQNLALATVNGPSQCVVAGPTAAIEALGSELAQRGVATRRLRTSHAFHSPMMEPIAAAFEQRVAAVRLSPPQLPYVSNVTGTWITAEQATDPTYWSRHLRGTVRFGDGLATLLEQPGRILLEVGPGRILGTMARQQASLAAVLATLPNADEPIADDVFLLTTTGRLWLAGTAIDWAALNADAPRRRVPLPTYPFERRRYWVDAGPATPGERRANGYAEDEAATGDWISAPTPPAPTLYERPALATIYVAPRDPVEEAVAAAWQELFGLERVGIHDDFFELGGHSLLAGQVVARLREAFGVDLPIRALFETPTIEALGERIAELLVEQVESMTDDEARRLVDSITA